MKRSFLPHVAAATAIAMLAACQNPTPPPPPHRHPGFNGPPQHDADDTTETTHSSDSTETTKTETETGKPDQHQPQAPDTQPAPAKVGNYEYGKPVPGKPGYVTSPYAPYSGYVDVRNIPPGTEVKDPYTNKIFLVP
jgi:hypothetical protein